MLYLNSLFPFVLSQKQKEINTELSQTGNIITRLILVGVVEDGGVGILNL